MTPVRFWRRRHLYRLGHLATEARHPLTWGLSTWAKDDLSHAFAALTAIDIQALTVLQRSAPAIAALRGDMRAALARPARIFLCGCGATGRLSLLLESLWREQHGPDDHRVCAFMAGGDSSCIHSRASKTIQRTARGIFASWVSAATTCRWPAPRAANAVRDRCRRGSRSSFPALPLVSLLQSRPPLVAHVERSRRVIESPAIRKINLTVGPMALAGSTRMQASTGYSSLPPDTPCSRITM